MFPFNIIAIPLGFIMKACYLLVKNYGIALILFTFLIKLILFPLSVKQQKNTARTAQLNPKLQLLQKKYANNKEKLNEERMKLYSEENVNPMSSCLPMLVTMLILFSLIEVVYSPLSYITGLEKDDIEHAKTVITSISTISKDVGDNNTTLEELIANGVDLETLFTNKEQYKSTAKLSESDRAAAIEIINRHPDIDIYFNDESKVSKSLKNRPELLVFSIIKTEYADIFHEDVIAEVSDIDYTFFGIFLGSYPSWKSILVLIPILSLISQLILTFVSQHYTKKNNTTIQMGMGMNAMFYIMPLFSFWIAFAYPAGMGLYWILSSVFQLGQTVLLNKVYTPERVAELIKKDQVKKKKKPSMYDKMMAAQQVQKGGGVSSAVIVEDPDAKLSKAELKEFQRKRLNEARKRMAEKYGEDYSEDDE
ncbi:MAG: YidC/Oxa1 family membrane protein insertase [Oscillospiraceae bacterium]|jgi:YidC/Oxa1 family membrane protein insertase